MSNDDTKLVCQRDPRELGIEREDGGWDLEALYRHILHCPTCRSFTDNAMAMVARQLAPRPEDT